MRLIGSPFSPFSRKVQLVLDHKGLEYDLVDGGTPEAHEELRARNRRAEVPVLIDGGLTIVNSADIVAHLDYVHPDTPVHPAEPADRVAARAWERLSDSTVDAIMVDISLWSWANRPDEMPDGMLEAAQRDLDGIYERLEAALEGSPHIVGDEISIADLALFPHLSASGVLGVPIDPERFPKLVAWLGRMFALPICQRDIERVREYLPKRAELGLEMDKIGWRGDRIEWVLARGFHDWLLGEIRADRVIWPL
jgi:glutathione S-transferase